MAKCIECQTEYDPTMGHKRCAHCMSKLPESDEEQKPENSSNQVGDASLTKTQDEPGNTKVMAVVDGEGTVAGRDIIIQNQSNSMYCDWGGEQFLGLNFRCPTCGREPLCAEHFNQGERTCPGCAEEASLPCALCDGRHAKSQMFTCPKCRLLVGTDHKHPDRELCYDCSAQYDKIIDDMERDAVGISVSGTVVGRDDVQLKNGVLMDKDGNQVSQLKSNTWYVRSKQWHTVKPSILRRERQIVERNYPNFSLHNTGDGSLYWQGVVKTWQGKEYEIRLTYPSNFPYWPIKAHVLSPRIKESRHIYPDGHLCLFHKDDKAWEPNTTCATVISWVSLWLHCYEVWTETGHWPRPEADQVVNQTNY